MLEEKAEMRFFFNFKENSSKTCTFLKYGSNGQFSGIQEIGTNRKLNRFLNLEENENETRGLACTKGPNPICCTSKLFNDFKKVDNAQALDH